MGTIRRPFLLWIAVLAGLFGGCSQPQDEASTTFTRKSSDGEPAGVPPTSPVTGGEASDLSSLPLKAALEHSYQLMRTGADCTGRLRELRDRFTAVEVTSPGAPAKWVTLDLNRHGARLDAICFTSRLDEPADMRWCFISRRFGAEKWFIVPMNGAIPGFTSFWQEFSVDTENLDEPTVNDTIYQALSGGQILPGEEYILWFTFCDSDPVELRVAIQLVPVSQVQQEPFRAEMVARDLGLQVPLRHHRPATPNEYVQQALQLTVVDLRRAVDMAEEGLEQFPDQRDLLKTVAALNHHYAVSLYGEDWEAGAAIYQKASELARKLIATHEDLTYNERFAVVLVLMDEVLVYAERQDAAKTIATLTEAFEAGFNAIPKLETAEQLAFLRENPEFAALLERWRKIIKPVGGLDYELQPPPADAVEFQGRWYKFYSSVTPWHIAQRRCRERGGYLACMESEAEATFIRTTWPEGESWLGGVLNYEGQWQWINGQPFTSTSWSDGEPSYSEQATYVKVGPDGLWHAAPGWDQANRGYLCEWERK